MIKKESIQQTAVCYWSKDDDAFVVESSLLPRTAGVGPTPEAAHKHFKSMLDGIYNHLTAGQVRGYSKRGRPRKGGLQLHTQIRPKTKTYIAEMSRKLDISLGEVLDYLCAFHHATARVGSFAEFFAHSPLRNAPLKITRTKSTPRKVVL